MKKKELFNFVVLTNNREESTRKIILQLGEFLEFGRIIVSDNGCRSEETFKVGGIPFIYVDNSKFPSAISHFYNILESEYKNLFVFHDDDQVQSFNFRKTLNYLIDNDSIEYAVSMRHESHRNIFYESYKEIFIDYFLKDNHPLISGQFIRDGKSLFDKVPDDTKFYITHGKYCDVAIVSLCLINKNSKCFNHNYVEYIEHDSNDNNTKSVESRLILQSFVEKQRGLQNYVMSGLIGYGYLRMLPRYILSLIMLISQPLLLKLYLLKFYRRYLNKLFFYKNGK